MTGSEERYERAKRVGAIVELEKLKAEIENMWIKSAKDLKTGEVIYENLCEHSEVLKIINKHISELKGETDYADIIAVLEWEDKCEKCWQTGVFNSECDCEECSHKDECSGYEGGED